MDLVLPESLRARLKIPMGELYPNIDRMLPIVKKKSVISVGDKVTDGLITRGIAPLLCVYDGKTKREEISIPDSISKYGAEYARVKNPAGEITSEAFKVLTDAFTSKKKTKIFVEGEEDLLTLAAIHLAPIGSYVIYGQPDAGAVLVEVNAKTKDFVEKIFAEMIRK